MEINQHIAYQYTMDLGLHSIISEICCHNIPLKFDKYISVKLQSDQTSLNPYFMAYRFLKFWDRCPEAPFTDKD